MDDSIKAIKRKFTAIIWGISLLFIINLFYLNGLFNAISKEIAKIVTLSIEEADGEELQYRLMAISSLPDSIHGTITKTIVIEDDDSDKKTSNDTTQLVIGVHKRNEIVFSQLIKEIRQTVHHAIDTILPPNLSLLDSLIVSNFKNRGISTRLYYSEIVDMNNNAVLASSLTTSGKTSNFYLYEFDTENRFAYKVYTASMTRAVLERMLGILLTTLLIIFLLGYAFWYFIRTVVKQKTLEEMKQDFTNNMTHELKTPIAVAYSAVDTLLNFKQGENSEKRKQYLNICIEQLSNLRDFVEQILSMSMERSKNIAIKKEKIALKPLLVSITNKQKLRADKQIDIDILVQPENLTVFADIIHISNILSNLIDNALKYSFDNVIIKINACQNENYCILSIKDNGIGISAENQKNIFDRFYRVPHGNLHKVKGYGLGLFYVKTMVEQHNGNISVNSEINKGSEFIIKIPTK